jgi:hypothetical protein
VRDWQAVWTRSATIKLCDFHLLPYYEVGDDGQDIVGHLVARCHKYQTRGFDVTSDLPESPDTWEQLNKDVLMERGIALFHFDKCRNHIPRALVDLDVLRLYDRWQAGGCKGEWWSRVPGADV